MVLISKVSKKILKEIAQIHIRFLWGGGTKINCISWENVKEEGGFGVKRLNLFNKALLSEWI